MTGQMRYSHQTGFTGTSVVFRTPWLARTLRILKSSVLAASCAMLSVHAAGVHAKDADKALTPFRIGTVDVISTLPVRVAEDQGYFKDEGLDVSFDSLTAGPAIIPTLLGGQSQLGLANSASIIQAISKGIPVKMVAPASYFNVNEGGPMEHALYVPGDSSITDPSDLAGKKIAVASIKNISELGITAGLKHKYNIDPSDLHFISLSFPDTIPALDAGRVDAALLVEPFANIYRKKGGRELMDQNMAFGAPDIPVMTSAWLATDRMIAEHPEQLEAFKRAMARGIEKIHSDPEYAKKVLTQFTGIDIKQASEIVFPTYRPDLELEAMRRMEDHMLDLKYIDRPVDIVTHVYTGPAK